MREIRFRGKRRDNKEWIYGSYVRCGEWMKKDFIMPDEDTRILYCYVVDPSTIGQFTGLLDKNGKEIYEGDIVQDRWGIHAVVFDGYRFNLKDFYVSCYDSPEDGFSECVDQIEVIGNIHDNAEMIGTCL